MALTKIMDGAYLVPLGNANAVLLDAGSDLILIDAGFLDKVDRMLNAISQLACVMLLLTHASLMMRGCPTAYIEIPFQYKPDRL